MSETSSSSSGSGRRDISDVNVIRLIGSHSNVIVANNAAEGPLHYPSSSSSSSSGAIPVFADFGWESAATGDHIDETPFSYGRFPIRFLNRSPASNHLWNFGDGVTSTEENPLHIYPNPIGEPGGRKLYRVRHTVTVGSKTYLKIKSIVIEAAPVLTADFGWEDIFGSIDLPFELYGWQPITIIDRSTPGFPVVPLSWRYDFGEGSLPGLIDIAVGSSYVGIYSNRIYHSDDLISWQQVVVNTQPFESVAYGNGVYVVVGQWDSVSDSNIWTSPDGINWTGQLWGYDHKDIIFEDGIFVIIDPINPPAGSLVHTSINGYDWTSIALATVEVYEYLAYGDGIFISVSLSGLMGKTLTSPNGITWTEQSNDLKSLAPSATVQGLIYDVTNEVFLATLDTGFIARSRDGLVWELIDAGTTNPLYGIISI